MEIIFLGTSAGRPSTKRFLPAAALKSTVSKKWCLIDCGEGTQYRILKSKLSIMQLELILITHLHGDHCFGLPGLIASMAMDNRENPLTIAGPKGIEDFLSISFKITDTHLPFKIKFIHLEKMSEPLLFNDFIIDKVELSHRGKSFGFIFKKEIIKKNLDVYALSKTGIEQGPLWGMLKSGMDVRTDDGKTFYSKDYLITKTIKKKIIICGDNSDPDKLNEVIADTDVLVHESTFASNVGKELVEYSKHSTAKIIAKYAEENHIKNLILTHFSQRYADKSTEKIPKHTIGEIEQEAKEYYKGNLYLANDFDHFILDNKLNLEKADH